MMVHSEGTNEEAFILYNMMDKQQLNSNPFFIEIAKRAEGLRTTSVDQAAPGIISLPA